MGTSSGSYHLICVTLHASLGKFRLVTIAWYAWLGIIGLLCIWLGVSGIGSLARDLSVCHSRAATRGHKPLRTRLDVIHHTGASNGYTILLKRKEHLSIGLEGLKS